MSSVYRLIIPGEPSSQVQSAAEISERLSALPRLIEGDVVSLEDGDRDYIRAKVSNDQWEIWRRRGGWWTKRSFSSAFTTGWSERLARSKKGIWKYFDEREQLCFATPQMIELFAAHFEGTRYPFGFVGAGG